MYVSERERQLYLPWAYKLWKRLAAAGSDNYLDGLEMLEYDMFYGKFCCYGGENPYTASELRMGLVPITISDIVWMDGIMTVSGEHFTRWSRVTVDGRMLETEFVDNVTYSSTGLSPAE